MNAEKFKETSWKAKEVVVLCDLDEYTVVEPHGNCTIGAQGYMSSQSLS
jgi:hypothetical protein